MSDGMGWHCGEANSQLSLSHFMVLGSLRTSGFCDLSPQGLDSSVLLILPHEGLPVLDSSA